jgi:hypothetical protein
MSHSWEDLAIINFEGAHYAFDQGVAVTKGTLGRVIIAGPQIKVYDQNGRRVASCDPSWGSWYHQASGQYKLVIPMIGSLVITPVR